MNLDNQTGVGMGTLPEQQSEVPEELIFPSGLGDGGDPEAIDMNSPVATRALVPFRMTASDVYLLEIVMSGGFY